MNRKSPSEKIGWALLINYRDVDQLFLLNRIPDPLVPSLNKSV